MAEKLIVSKVLEQLIRSKWTRADLSRVRKSGLPGFAKKLCEIKRI